MSDLVCRACRGRTGQMVLDLGEQPASDYFPECNDPGPDPVYPLQMWLCSACGLAQLAVDPTLPEEPRAAEPAALITQAARAVRDLATAGWLPPGASVAEYGSPHGGSWSALLQQRGLSMADEQESADVVLDCFGLMHCADQAHALAERAARVTEGGVLLLQYYPLATIMRHGQWNALRHGHYAYYSTAALTGMLATVGFTPCAAWRFDLYGGTVLLAATRGPASEAGHNSSIQSLLIQDEALGVRDLGALRGLQHRAEDTAEALRHWLVRQRSARRSAFGYGAASRAVALLCMAGADRGLLAAVADASPSKQGRRMPGTDIPIIGPDELVATTPDVVLLLLPELLSEVRTSFPTIEAAGACWVDVETFLVPPQR